MPPIGVSIFFSLLAARESYTGKIKILSLYLLCLPRVQRLSSMFNFIFVKTTTFLQVTVIMVSFVWSQAYCKPAYKLSQLLILSWIQVQIIINLVTCCKNTNNAWYEPKLKANSKAEIACNKPNTRRDQYWQNHTSNFSCMFLNPNVFFQFEF